MSDVDLDAAVDDIRIEYSRRKTAPQCTGQYSFLNPTHATLVLDRERAILAALARHLTLDPAQADVLDVGAGSGVSLAFLAAYGFTAHRLHGLDIVPERVEKGREQFPGFDFRLGDGHSLPYEDASFDIVQQITMLSSVHDDGLRRAIGREIVRVLRPGGLFLSFDVTAVSIVPRALNRLLSLRRKVQPGSGQPAPDDAGSASAPIRLKPVRPLEVSDLLGLFEPLRPLEMKKLTPYRPLVDRTRGELALALLRTLPRFSTTLLFVARAPK
jgi:ubiquinone/menaquinone biosynthesis C-methylase UbiE